HAAPAAHRVLIRDHAHSVCGVVRLHPHLRPQARRRGAAQSRAARARCRQRGVGARPGHAGGCRLLRHLRARGRRGGGAESRLAGLSAAAVVLVLVLAFLGWIERIPEPALAAIVIHAVSKSLRLSAFRNYFVWKTDRLVVLAAVLGVIVLGVLDGLLGAI